MTYPYPPPSNNKLKGGYVMPSAVYLPDLNIPPPGFNPMHATRSWNQNLPHGHPTTSFQPSPDIVSPLLLPPPVPSFQESKQWSQTSVHPTEIKKERNFLPSEEKSDSLWVKECLQRRITYTSSSQKESVVSMMKVYEAKQLLQLCLMDLEKLYSLQKELNMNYCNLTPISWKEKWDEVIKLKVNINNCMKKFDDATLNSLKIKLQKRCKKRERQRRQNAAHKEMVAETYARRQNLHRTIDTWLKNMQEVVEKAKREESLKLEADRVLSEVTRKKAEARRQISMLAALQKLRHIRAQTASNRGERVNADNGIRFLKVIEHLQKLWKDQLKDYDIEEQGLRVMLEEAVEERTKMEVSQEKQVLAEWEALLFGKRVQHNSFYMAANHDLEAFVEIRKSWDKFLAPPGAVMSSSIPVGWVLPSNPSSEKWESLLQEDKDKH